MAIVISAVGGSGPTAIIYFSLESNEIPVGTTITLRGSKPYVYTGTCQVTGSGTSVINGVTYRYVEVPTVDISSESFQSLSLLLSYHNTDQASIETGERKYVEICPTPFFSKSVSTEKFSGGFVNKKTFVLSGQVVGSKCEDSIESLHEKTKQIILNFSQNFKKFELYDNDSTVPVQSMDFAFVESIDFEQSKYVGIIPFSITISGYDSSLDQLVSDPQEEYVYNEENGSIVSINHNISCISLYKSGDLLEEAQEFIQSRAAKTKQSFPVPYGFQIDKYPTRLSRSQTVNKLTGKVSYSEKFIFDKENSFGNSDNAELNYVFTKNIEIDNSDGVVIVSLEGNVQGPELDNLEDIETTRQALIYAANVDPYTICNNSYKIEFSTEENLHLAPDSYRVTEDQEKNAINISASYRNIPKDDPFIKSAFSYSNELGTISFTADIDIVSQYGSPEERLDKTTKFYASTNWKDYILSKYIKYGYGEEIDSDLKYTEDQYVFFPTAEKTVGGSLKVRATAITPRHVVMSNSANWGVGDSIKFKRENGDDYNVSIIATRNLPNSNDLTVGLLELDLPSDIKPAKIIPYFLTDWVHSRNFNCGLVFQGNDLSQKGLLDYVASVSFPATTGQEVLNFSFLGDSSQLNRSPVLSFDTSGNAILMGYTKTNSGSTTTGSALIGENLKSVLSAIIDLNLSHSVNYMPENAQDIFISEHLLGFSGDFDDKSFSVKNESGDISFSIAISNQKILHSYGNLSNMEYTINVDPPNRVFSESKSLKKGCYYIQDLNYFTREKITINGSCVPLKCAKKANATDSDIDIIKNDISDFVHSEYKKYFNEASREDSLLDSESIEINKNRSQASFKFSWNQVGKKYLEENFEAFNYQDILDKVQLEIIDTISQDVIAIPASGFLEIENDKKITGKIKDLAINEYSASWVLEYIKDKKPIRVFSFETGNDIQPELGDEYSLDTSDPNINKLINEFGISEFILILNIDLFSSQEQRKQRIKINNVQPNGQNPIAYALKIEDQSIYNDNDWNFQILGDTFRYINGESYIASNLSAYLVNDLGTTTLIPSSNTNVATFNNVTFNTSTKTFDRLSTVINQSITIDQIHDRSITIRVVDDLTGVFTEFILKTEIQATVITGSVSLTNRGGILQLVKDSIVSSTTTTIEKHNILWEINIANGTDVSNDTWIGINQKGHNIFNFSEDFINKPINENIATTLDLSNANDSEYYGKITYTPTNGGQQLITVPLKNFPGTSSYYNNEAYNDFLGNSFDIDNIALSFLNGVWTLTIGGVQLLLPDTVINPPFGVWQQQGNYDQIKILEWEEDNSVSVLINEHFSGLEEYLSINGFYVRAKYTVEDSLGEKKIFTSNILQVLELT